MTKKKINIYWPGISLMLSLAILAVPATVLYNIAMEAQEIAGNPVFGDRFSSEINPKISRNQVNELAVIVKGSDPLIVNSTLNLKAATLRINILTELTITEAQLNTLLTSVKNAIFSKLPESEYFTASLTYKQYDIEIHVKNTDDRLDEAYIYVIASKSSLVSTFMVQEVSTPKNPEFVAALYAALNPLPAEDDDE